MMEKLKQLARKMNDLGIPLPNVRDPKTGKGSVSLTLVFISFNLCLVGIVGKWSKVLDVDINQAINLFMVCAGLYWGRKFQHDSDEKGVLDTSGKDKENGKEEHKTQ
jgi:hypothetical protein